MKLTTQNDKVQYILIDTMVKCSIMFLSTDNGKA